MPKVSKSRHWTFNSSQGDQYDPWPGDTYLAPSGVLWELTGLDKWVLISSPY